MMRMAFSVAGAALGMTWAVSGVAAEPLAEAKAKIAQCIEKEGDEYVAARNWLIEHPEALDSLGEDSWKERWVKRICKGWIENRDLYEREMKSFELGEMHARHSVRVGVPDPFSWAKGASRTHGDKDIPLAVECLWKTGRGWRRYKAWRMYAVVEYLKMMGGPSVLDPAMDVLVSRSSGEEQAPDPGCEYPRMDPGMRAFAELFDQMAPYRPVEIILTFGDKSTLTKLQRLMDSTETAETLKKVLKTTITLLRQRLEAKRQGQPVEKVGQHDLYAEFGDATTLKNMRTFWGRATGPYAEKFHRDIAKLEKRLQEEEKPAEMD